MSRENPSSFAEQGREKEISPEKRRELWKTLRYVALGGLVTLGGMEAVERGKAEIDSLKITKTEDLGSSVEEHDGHLYKKFAVETADGKRYEGKVGIQMSPAELSEAEKGFTITGPLQEGMTVGEVPLQRGATEKGMTAREVKGDQPDWNTSYLESLHGDGSGIVIRLDTTHEGLKITSELLGPGGVVESSHVSHMQPEK